MTEANRIALEKFRPVYNCWINDKSLPQYDWQEVLRVIREEFDPYRSVDYWCGACLARLLEDAFNYMATTAAPVQTDIVRVKF